MYALQEGGLGSPRRNWNVLLDGTRLIMCLIFLREDYLVRDRGLSRTEKDAKAYNWFWLKCAKAFNDPTAFGVSLHGNAADVERFATFGLDAKWSTRSGRANLTTIGLFGLQRISIFGLSIIELLYPGYNGC